MPADTDFASPAPRLGGWVPRVLLVLATLLVYANSWNAPFVYDDILAIPENQTIRSLWPLRDVLLPHGQGGLTVSGRPLLNLSFALNYAVSGPAVWSYHVFNILVHAVSGLALFGVVRRTLQRGIGLETRQGLDAANGGLARLRSSAEHVALAIAALWVLHPLHTQAVTYTVQRAESLMGCFYWLTLYTFARGADLQRGKENVASTKSARAWFTLSVIACVFGMATKEVMVTAPVLVLLYDRTFMAGSFAAAWRQRRGVHLALAATWIVLIALMATTGFNRGGTIGFGIDMPLFAYPATQFKALAFYLARSFWPHPLIFEYGTNWVNGPRDILPFAALLAPMIAGTIVALWRWPALGFLGVWFFGNHAPTSLPQGTLQMIVEHRTYLPLAAVVTLLVVTLHRVAGQRGLLASAVLAVALGGLTARRNHDYRSNLSLWTDTVMKRPLNPRAREGLAEALTAEGRFQEAAQHRREAVRLQPSESTSFHNLGVTLTEAGQDDEAIAQYRRALNLGPNEARTHNNLAILLAQRGEFEAALPHYHAAIRLGPNEPLYHYNFGTALMRGDRHAEAADQFNVALKLQPEHADARFNLGTALVRINRLNDALQQYAEAMRLRPRDAATANTYGGALLLAGRPAAALTVYQRLLEVAPDHLDGRFGLGSALAALGRFDEAIAAFEAVLRAKPDYPNAHFKLGNALLDMDRVSEAVPHYQAALRLSPDGPEAHHNFGIALARLERWSEAQRAFETALRLKPDYADAQRSLDQLQRMLGR